jgi:hypothetical protein
MERETDSVNTDMEPQNIYGGLFIGAMFFYTLVCSIFMTLFPHKLVNSYMGVVVLGVSVFSIVLGHFTASVTTDAILAKKKWPEGILAVVSVSTFFTMLVIFFGCSGLFIRILR